MTVPLNGALLNGSSHLTSFTWAWGWARAEATATAEPVVNRVYSDARATAGGEATVSETIYKAAYTTGASEAFADAAIEATRYAPMGGASVGEAVSQASGVRIVFFDGTVTSEALAVGYGDRAKQFVAVGEASAHVALDDGLVRRHRLATSRNTPALARSWLAESAIERIQVRQQYARGTSVARSHTRLLANATIGRGRLEIGSTFAADNLRVNTYHAFAGSCVAEATGASQPDRISIIIGGSLGTAEMRLAPTIERDGKRLSYNSGVAEPQSAIVESIYVTRRPTAPAMQASAAWTNNATYLVRGMAGSVAAYADTRFSGRTNLWRWGRGVAEARAALAIDADRYRWRATEVKPAIAQATVSAEWIRQRYGEDSQTTVRAFSQATNRIVRHMASDPLQASAETTGWNRLFSYARGSDSAFAGVDILANAARGRFMDGAIEAEAEGIGKALRIVWGVGAPEVGIASATRFVYRINIDSDAPTRRTIELPLGMRHLALPATTREYRVK